MKLWERINEGGSRREVTIREQQSGFIQRNTTDVRDPREELWSCVRKSGVAEQSVWTGCTRRARGDEVCGRSDRWVEDR